MKLNRPGDTCGLTVGVGGGSWGGIAGDIPLPIAFDRFNGGISPLFGGGGIIGLSGGTKPLFGGGGNTRLWVGRYSAIAGGLIGGPARLTSVPIGPPLNLSGNVPIGAGGRIPPPLPPMPGAPPGLPPPLPMPPPALGPAPGRLIGI